MANITDSVLLSLPLSFDSKTSNLVLSGSIITVETIEEYLERVDINSRYAGMEVTVLSPFGDYSINTFSSHMQLGNITFSKYIFEKTGDDDLVLEGVVSNLKLTDLIDVPSSYVDKADKILVVKPTEDGMDFVNRTYVFDQGTPSQIWSIAHGLGKFPSVTIKNSAGDVVEGFINFIDNNNLTITFNSGFSGKAILN